jgi:STE24 endopeptidase
VARTKFGLLTLLVNYAVLIGFTLLGGLQWLALHLNADGRDRPCCTRSA